MKKKIKFKIVLLLIPIIFFLTFELLLRFFNYGDDFPLFTPMKSNTEKETFYFRINKDVSKRYFRNLSVSFALDTFLKEKPDSTCRIFIQGGSTALGFPYNHSGSFPKLLLSRLEMSFPNQHFEIINTSMTAVNSYTLLDISDEIIQQKPDIVLIYAGHNEYYGALGIGSTYKFANHPVVVHFILRLRKFRIYQLLQNIILPIRSNNTSTEEKPLMQIMAKEQHIAKDSKIYQAGIQQFYYNLDRILAKYKKHDIPVFIGNLVSNERDQIPFVTKQPDKNLKNYYDQLKNSSFVNKLALLDSMIVFDSTYANLYFEAAQMYYKLGKYDKAKKYYRNAKEHDLLKFRAPEKFNEIIYTLAKRHDAHFVDVEKIFEENSEDGIIGDAFMIDHLHPNISGYFLMANAFYHALWKSGLMQRSDHYITDKLARKEIIIPAVDSIYAEYIATKMKSRWPFKKRDPIEDPVTKKYTQKTFPEKLAFALYAEKINWVDATEKLCDYYCENEDYVKALSVAHALRREFLYFELPYYMIGTVYYQSTEYQKALAYYQKTYQIEKSRDLGIKIILLYIRLNNFAQAKMFLQQFTTKDQELKKIELAITTIEKNLAMLEKNPDNVELLIELGKIYRYLDCQDIADKYFKKVVTIDPGNKAVKDYL